ncbi:YciI family protein [Salinisphaera sp. T31B1]|uniref:YciI family protein n=1 Tax=Salinisphaera sp. T31B1 TaxID=727963 RepID=UPI00333F552F
MPYLIETYDKPDHHDLRLSTRDVHLAYLDANAERLIACGAKLDDAGEIASGGIYLVDVDTRAAAERFIEADPFHQAELFERVVITRWRKAYVDGRNVL